MGIKRYELNEAQWSRVASLVPGKVADPGRTGADDRLFVNGCFWCCARACTDLPESQRAKAVLADKAYDGNDLRDRIAGMNATAVTLSKRNRKVAIPHDGDIYRHRNQIERCFSRLEHFRRFATRYYHRTVHFTGFVHLPAAMILLRRMSIRPR